MTFLKWVGGKQQIVDAVVAKFPKRIRTYHEPFLGGGSVLLSVLESDISVERIRVNDINKYLIRTYEDVRNNVEELVEILRTFCHGEKEYYEYRNLFNSNKKLGVFSVEMSALFIFLNKTCFRGLYREGPNGFNVPFGHYKNPNWINEDALRKCSKLIQRVEFYSVSYETFLVDVHPQDFVYLDPPYVPETKTSFTKYNVNDFTDHERLFSLVKTIPRFVMSNSKTRETIGAFEGFSIEEIHLRRSIHSKNPGHLATEILVYRI